LVGAQRCGTTSIVRFLMQFPEIEFVTPIKPEPRLLLSRDLNVVGSWDEKQPGTKILCEKSTSYIEFPDVASIIDKNFKSAKVIIMIRDPVQRAISNYFFTRLHGLEHRPLEEALFSDANLQIPYLTSVSPFAYIERGFYLNYINPFVDALGRERVFIGVLENMLAEQKYRDELITYLGIGPKVSSVELSKINEAEHHENVPCGVTERLAAIYRQANNDLHDKFSIDLSGWYL